MFYGDSNLSRRSASGSSVQPEYMSGKTPTFSPQVRYRPLGERLKIILDRVVLSSRFFYSPGAQQTPRLLSRGWSTEDEWSCERDHGTLRSRGPFGCVPSSEWSGSPRRGP